MATTRYALSTTEWTQITAAGESGTCWLKDTGGGMVAIDHTITPQGATIERGSAAEATANINVNKSFLIKSNENHVEIPADDASDVYYATLVSGQDRSAAIVADVT